MVSEDRVLAIENELREQRDRLGDTATAIYQRIEAERLTIRQDMEKLEERVMPAPLWKRALTWFGIALGFLLLFALMTYLASQSLLPEGFVEAVMKKAEEVGP